MTETLYIKDHKFELVHKSPEDGGYIRLHNTITLYFDDVPVMTFIDCYADFDGHRISLLHYHNKQPAGSIDLDTIANLFKRGINGK